MKDPCCDTHQRLGSQIAEWVIGLWSTISLLSVWTWHTLPVKWPLLRSTAREEEKKTEGDWQSAEFDGKVKHDVWQAWSKQLKSMTWMWTAKQKCEKVAVGYFSDTCVTYMFNFVTPVSLSVSFMYMWWQLTPVVSHHPSTFLYLSSCLAISLSLLLSGRISMRGNSLPLTIWWVVVVFLGCFPLPCYL